MCIKMWINKTHKSKLKSLAKKISHNFTQHSSVVNFVYVPILIKNDGTIPKLGLKWLILKIKLIETIL